MRSDVAISDQVRASNPRTQWRDTREWLERVDAIGQLRIVRGANWQSEIGEITEMLDHAEGSPAVVFDDVPGYPSGLPGPRQLRAARPQRQAVTLNLPQSETATTTGLFRFWRGVLDGPQPGPAA